MAAPQRDDGDGAARPVVLRLASCNILHGLVLPEAVSDITTVARWIEGLGADVVALQEVDRGQSRSGGVDQTAAIAEHLGWYHAFAPALVGSPDSAWDVPLPGTGTGSGAAQGESYGVALVSRHPLSAVTVTRLPGGGPGWRRTPAAVGNPGYDREPRTALSATVLSDGAALRVTTTHLSYLPWRGLRQAHAAAAAAGWSGPAALLGDLNLPAWAVRLLLARPGASRWTHAGGTPTYPAWGPRLQTDQLLVRSGAVVIGLAVGTRGTSDHLPLVASVAVPRGAAPHAGVAPAPPRRQDDR